MLMSWGLFNLRFFFFQAIQIQWYIYDAVIQI